VKIVLNTVAAITLGLLPVAASPLMGQYLGTDGAYRTMEASLAAASDPTPIPICDFAENPLIQTFNKD